MLTTFRGRIIEALSSNTRLHRTTCLRSGKGTRPSATLSLIRAVTGLLLFSLSGFALACAPADGGPSAKSPKGARLATAASGPERPALTRRATLKYEIKGKSFPLPIVTGTIAGQPVNMLVDTGANSHVIAGWFAKRHALPMKKLGDIGTDHVGRTIVTYRIDKPDMAIDEWGKLAVSTVLATDVPEVIEKLGIGAFISPQRLIEEGDSVVLDLPKGELRAAYWEEAFPDLPELGAPFVWGADLGHPCEENEGPVKGLAFVVPATIDNQRVQLLVDTGAQHSDVFAGSNAGMKLFAQSIPNREPMYTASGKVSARKLKSVKVTTGSFSVTSDVDLIQGAADGSCPRDGVLAMDVLRSCTLLLGRKQIAGRCLANPK